MKVWFLGDPGFEAKAAGKKAACLHELWLMGLRVPPGFAIGSCERVDAGSATALQVAVDRIGGFPVAVRASSGQEDPGQASFAGQHASFLNVQSVAELIEKVSACRAHAGSESVARYARHQGSALDPGQVAVLVQRMVDATVAGVIFAIHPVSGREEHALVECCRGLGDQLVTGRVAPTRFVLDLRDGALVEFQTGAAGVSLTNAALRQLGQLALLASAHFGTPQHLGWAQDAAGTLHLLQSRPVTRIQWRTDVEELTGADLGDGGVFARVCTPLMFSLYQAAFNESMQTYLEAIRLLPRGRRETWMVHYYGRVYWSASASRRALEKVLRPPIPVVLALEASFKRCLRRARGFGSSFEILDAARQARIERFASTVDPEFFRDLVSLHRDYYLLTERATFTTIFNHSSLQTLFWDFLRKLDAEAGGETSVVRLFSGLSPISYLQMQRELAGGITPTDPDTTEQAQRAQYQGEVAAVIGRLEALGRRGKRLLAWRLKRQFLRRLAQVRTFLVEREQMREYSSRATFVVRQYLVEAGRRLSRDGILPTVDAVFMLRIEELLEVLRGRLGGEALDDLLRWRSLLHQSYRRFEAPSEFGRGVRPLASFSAKPPRPAPAPRAIPG